jgi:CheY-like chemotaxis protein
MFQKEWPVLVVDDDTDVLAVSRLAMRDFKVNGLPVTLHTASSKAEAIELLTTRLSGALFPYVAVALIDVVMETDQAGLELCQYIRETLDNRMTQIFIRTGQPGVAPERQVMDRYDINGYFTKVEATEDKLYSIVKSGVREFAFVSQALGSFKTAMYAVRAQTPADLQAGLSQAIASASANALGQPIHADSYQMQVGLLIGDRLLVGSLTENEAIAERDRLVRLGLKPLGTEGDQYATDGSAEVLHLQATPAHDESWHITRHPSPPSTAERLLQLYLIKIFATLGKRVGFGAREAVAH